MLMTDAHDHIMHCQKMIREIIKVRDTRSWETEDRGCSTERVDRDTVEELLGS